MMHKTILALVLTVASVASVVAQGIGFGIKAGANIANTDISSDFGSLNTKSKFGFHAGAFATIMFSDKLGIQPELLYSSQGSEYDEPSFTGELNMSYLNIPVLLRYNLNEMFSLHVGPQFGFLTKAEEDLNGTVSDIKDDFKGSDISAAFGLDVDLPMKLGFGARYVLGLSNVLEDGSSFGNAELKNGVIQLYAKFRLFGK